jgi:ATP-binding cassette subfamily F protein uup
MQYTPSGKLSGGERRRLYMIRTLMRDPNFLILDERPTTSTSPRWRRSKIPGCLQGLPDYDFARPLFPRSRRGPRDRVRGRRAIEALPGQLQCLCGSAPRGDATTHAEAEAQREASARQEAERRDAAKRAKPRLVKLSGAARTGHAGTRDPALETEIGRLETAMSAAATDHIKLTALANEHETALKRLAEKMERWEALAAVTMEG